jgi:hypothetical protein
MKFDNAINEVKIDILYKHYKNRGKSVLKASNTGDKIQDNNGNLLLYNDYENNYQNKYPELEFKNYVSDVIKRQERRALDRANLEQDLKNDQREKNKEITRGLSLPKKKVS